MAAICYILDLPVRNIIFLEIEVNQRTSCNIPSIEPHIDRSEQNLYVKLLNYHQISIYKTHNMQNKEHCDIIIRCFSVWGGTGGGVELILMFFLADHN